MLQCAFLFFAQMLAFAFATGSAAAQNNKVAAVGIALTGLNCLGFIFAMQSWIKNGDRK